MAAKLRSLADNDPLKNNYWRKTKFRKKRKIRAMKNGGGLWDADHILPVKSDGGQYGLDNLRTLCIKCHLIVTHSKFSVN